MNPDGSLDRQALDHWLTTPPDDDLDGLACGSQGPPDHLLEDHPSGGHRCELDAGHPRPDRHECACGLEWVVEFHPAIAPVIEETERGVESLVIYAMELEELVRWLALPYSYEDPSTGVRVQGHPVWSFRDLYGHQLPANERLARTWAKVFHESPPGEDASEEEPPID